MHLSITHIIITNHMYYSAAVTAWFAGVIHLSMTYMIITTTLRRLPHLCFGRFSSTSARGQKYSKDTTECSPFIGGVTETQGLQNYPENTRSPFVFGLFIFCVCIPVLMFLVRKRFFVFDKYIY